MKKAMFLTQILALCPSLMFGCAAQNNNEKEQSKIPVAEKTIGENDGCWKEFKDLTVNVSVKFCGKPQKDILNDTFNGSNIKRNSYLVLDTNINGNARHFLGWFDWKLKSEDKKSLRKFYDEYTSDALGKDSRGSIKETKEISLNGKIGRETTLVAPDSNPLTVRVFYSNGKVIYIGFLPDELYGNKSVQDKSRKTFFESLQIMESK